DSFILDLLRLETGWQTKLLGLLETAESPLVRYLASYLANRLASGPRPLLHIAAVEEALNRRLRVEMHPVVTRELLGTLTQHGCPIPESVMRRHLAHPIPLEAKRAELRDYYGSLEEARVYLRERLKPPSLDALRLFYLISLAAVATVADAETFEFYV